jgi:hypothetical protein
MKTVGLRRAIQEVLDVRGVAIERDYLATLSDACPPDAWTCIVQRAVEEGLR